MYSGIFLLGLWGSFLDVLLVHLLENALSRLALSHQVTHLGFLDLSAFFRVHFFIRLFAPFPARVVL